MSHNLWWKSISFSNFTKAFESPTRVNINIPAMVTEEEDEVFVDGSSRSTADSTRLDAIGDDKLTNDDDDLSEIQWNWTGTIGLNFHNKDFKKIRNHHTSVKNMKANN